LRPSSRRRVGAGREVDLEAIFNEIGDRGLASGEAVGADRDFGGKQGQELRARREALVQPKQRARVDSCHEAESSFSTVEAMTPSTLSTTSTIQGPKPRRLGNGSIGRAVMATLADGQVMKLEEIHVTVGKLLGRQVSYASVEWCLRMGVRGAAPWAVCIRPGWYRLN
jgi:hypothetical protein